MPNSFIIIWLNAFDQAVIHVIENISQIESDSYILLNSRIMGVLREERSLVDPESLSELWVQIAEPNHSLYSSSGNGL